jgi:hypothetical protein
MQNSKPTLDEMTYLAGCTLKEAISQYCTPASLQKYNHLLNSRPNFPSGQNTNTLIGTLQVISESLENSNNRQKELKDAIGVLYREIFDLVKTGKLIPYSYQLPRQLSDVPIGIPPDMFLSGEIDWNNSELTYRNFQFTGIRLIENKMKNKIEIQKINSDIKSEIPDNLENKKIKSKNKNFEDIDPNQFIDEKLAAEFLGISPRTLQGYRSKGGGPLFHKITHKVVRYKFSDLIDWTNNKKRKNTSQI